MLCDKCKKIEKCEKCGEEIPYFIFGVNSMKKRLLRGVAIKPKVWKHGKTEKVKTLRGTKLNLKKFFD